MKMKSSIHGMAAVSLLSVAAGCFPANDKAAEKSVPVQPTECKVSEVKGVEPAKMVKVSDFGWNAEDATEIVQKALDSGAKRVVFDNRGAPWIVRPLKARSNTDIVFEDGVELLAKKGEFHGKRDFLLDMSYVTNSTLTGLGEKGGTLRMRKSDYQKPPYSRSEWRYALSLLGAKQVKIENMSFVESGGDGMCLGRDAQDIVIRKCRCIGNHRQGISVCSAKNLLIEDCVLSNTKGTAPAAGIDFEPDHPRHRLSNCVMRNCRIEGNAGKGIDIFLPNQKKSSEPIGIRIENCHISGNSAGTEITVGPMDFETNGPKGSIVFANCTFSANKGGAIGVCRKPDDFTLRFEDCTITNEKHNVWFANSRWDAPMPCGIVFDNLTVHCQNGQDWYTPKPVGRGLNAKIPANITGNVTIVRPDGGREEKTITQEWAKRTFALANATPPMRISALPSLKDCVLRDAKPGEMVSLSPVELLWKLEYVFFAERPGKVKFRARLVSKTDGAKSVSPGRLLVKRSLSARKEMAIIALPGAESFEFEVSVPSRGFYVLSNRITHARILLEAADVPVAVYVGDQQQLALIGDSREHSVWVNVPKYSKAVAFVTKGGSNSNLGAKLVRPDGKVASQNAQIEDWTVLQEHSPAAGLWRIDILKPERGHRKYFYLDVTGVPGLVWLSKDKTVAF